MVVAWSLFQFKFNSDAWLMSYGSGTDETLYRCGESEGMYQVFRSDCSGDTFSGSRSSLWIHVASSILSNVILLYSHINRSALGHQDYVNTLSLLKSMFFMRSLTLYNYINFTSEIINQDLVFTYSKSSLLMVLVLTVGSLLSLVIMMLAAPMSFLSSSLLSGAGDTTGSVVWLMRLTVTMIIYAFLNYIGIANVQGSGLFSFLEFRGPGLSRVIYLQVSNYFLIMVQFTGCLRIEGQPANCDSVVLEDVQP
jgi:hypothetical protein